MKFLGKLFRLLSPLFQTLYRAYASFQHTYAFRGLKIRLQKGVFNPLFFNSSIDLIDYIFSLNLPKGTFLELGCGSSMASVYFASKGWQCTATDISLKAIENAKINAKANGLDIEVRASDLYDKITDRKFDVVFINPPYFPQEVKKEEDNAWFCGNSYEYYQKLFAQMATRELTNEQTLMVLSDQCEIETIKQKANDHKLQMELLHVKHHFYESIQIYRITNGSPL